LKQPWYLYLCGRKPSRPARARGLKHEAVRPDVRVIASRPARARGLKQFPEALMRDVARAVAPRAGAWIETCSSRSRE